MQPSPEMIEIATEAALTQAVIPPPAPGLNTSFSTHFYGLTVQCSTPTQSQQADFDNLANRTTYAGALLITLIAMCVRVYSLMQNGAYHDVSFSTFMVTTRNVDLDTISADTCLEDVKTIEETKLMFGLVNDDLGTESKQERHDSSGWRKGK